MSRRLPLAGTERSPAPGRDELEAPALPLATPSLAVHGRGAAARAFVEAFVQASCERGGRPRLVALGDAGWLDGVPVEPWPAGDMEAARAQLVRGEVVDARRLLVLVGTRVHVVRPTLSVAIVAPGRVRDVAGHADVVSSGSAEDLAARLAAAFAL